MPYLEIQMSRVRFFVYLFRLREASHIDFAHKKHQLYFEEGGRGVGAGGGCDVCLWHVVGRFSIFVKKN